MQPANKSRAISKNSINFLIFVRIIQYQEVMVAKYNHYVNYNRNACRELADSSSNHFPFDCLPLDLCPGTLPALHCSLEPLSGPLWVSYSELQLAG